MPMIQNFIAGTRNIKFINNVSTGLIHPETTVKIINQTPVYIEYDMTSPEYTGRIVFNGEIVCFSAANVELEKFGYMKLKLNALRRELDKKIKTNEKALARATRHNARVARWHETLANRVLGRGGI